MIELIHQGKGIGAGCGVQAEREHRIACSGRGRELPSVAACVKGDRIADSHAAALQTQGRHAIGGQRVAQRFVRAGLEQGADVAAGQYGFPGHIPGTTGDTVAGAGVSRAFHHTVLVHAARELIDRGDRGIIVHRDHQAVGGCRYRVAIKVGSVDGGAKGDGQIVLVQAGGMIELIHQGKGIGASACVQTESEHRIACSG